MQYIKKPLITYSGINCSGVMYPFQWLLNFLEVGGLFIPTNRCSEAGEMLATVQLSDSSPNHHTHTHTPSNTYTVKQTWPAIVLL